jgi:TolA-binding protein
MSRPLGAGLLLACLWLGLAVIPVAAGGEASQKGSATTSEKSSGLSTDNLRKQITDLDGQIQKLREQSLALQEKTQAKLQAQLESFKSQRDSLIPRIEKLQDNSEKAWQDIKEKIQKAIEDLKASIDTMRE